MNTRKLFENYWDNKAKVVLFESLIDSRKIELMSSMTPVLSHEPKAHNNNSIVESTAIKWQEDEKILGYKRSMKEAENASNTVDKLLTVLNPKMRDIMVKRYIAQWSLKEIADKECLSESWIDKKIRQTFERLDEIAEYL